MVQVAIFFYGLAMIGFRLPIILAGINAIDKGQVEAVRAIWTKRGQSFRYIIFPQAIKNMLHAIGNEFVVNIKDTAVLRVIGVSGLFYKGKSVAGTYYRYTESFVIVAVLWLINVLITTRLLTILIKLANVISKLIYYLVTQFQWSCR